MRFTRVLLGREPLQVVGNARGAAMGRVSLCALRGVSGKVNFFFRGGVNCSQEGKEKEGHESSCVVQCGVRREHHWIKGRP